MDSSLQQNILTLVLRCTLAWLCNLFYTYKCKISNPQDYSSLLDILAPLWLSILLSVFTFCDNTLNITPPQWSPLIIFLSQIILIFLANHNRSAFNYFLIYLTYSISPSFCIQYTIYHIQEKDLDNFEAQIKWGKFYITERTVNLESAGSVLAATEIICHYWKQYIEEHNIKRHPAIFIGAAL